MVLDTEQHHKLESVNWQQDGAEPYFEESIYTCFVRKFPCGFVAVGQASSTQGFLVLHLVNFHVDYNQKLSVWARRLLTFYK